MNNIIKKKIIATIAVTVISIQVLLLFSSALYSCFTQNPKVLYYAICFQLEQNKDASIYGKINSVIKGIRVYSSLNPLFDENNIKLFWIDIWGYVQKKLGIIYFPGIDEDMICLDNGHLVFVGRAASNVYKIPSEKELYLDCEKYKVIYQFFCEQNIEFLHIVFPIHMHQKSVLPFGLRFSYNQNATEWIIELNENGIPVIDARELFLDSPDVHYQLFYKGDHHWKPEYAYRVYTYISQELKKQNSPMTKYFNCENMAWSDYYIEESLPPFHNTLGTGMRRVGRYYLTERDITPYMIPRYETNYTFHVPSKEISKTGPVLDTFLDYFADEPIEIIINNRVKNKSKIFVFHDSFIHSFAPFLATNNYCLYMIDLRHYHGNIIDLIEQEKPDAIIFAYSYWPSSQFELFVQQLQEKQKLNKAVEND